MKTREIFVVQRYTMCYSLLNLLNLCIDFKGFLVGFFTTESQCVGGFEGVSLVHFSLVVEGSLSSVTTLLQLEGNAIVECKGRLSNTIQLRYTPKLNHLVLLFILLVWHLKRVFVNMLIDVGRRVIIYYMDSLQPLGNFSIIPC